MRAARRRFRDVLASVADRLVYRRGDDAGLLHVRRRTPRPSVTRRDPIRALDMVRERGMDHAGFEAREQERLTILGSADLGTRLGAATWYHTIELPGGLVTPGLFDHRDLVAEYGLPSSLAGQRALDVATFDGFWAYELERRGADVTALDLATTREIDFPPQARDQFDREQLSVEVGRGFSIASEALESHVVRREGSVYSLDPDTWGRFDFVHVGDLLLHLERPLEALRRIRSVTGGILHISDAYDPALDGDEVRYLGGWEGAVWWVPSLDTLCQWIIDAGFDSVDVLKCYRLDWVPNSGRGLMRAVIRAGV